MTKIVLTPTRGHRAKDSTYVLPSQNSHAIPKQLFEGSSQHDLIEFFRTLPNWENAFDFLNGPENTQRLPVLGNPNGDSAHLGSHPSITDEVKFKLNELRDQLTRDQGYQADRQLAAGGDVAAQGRVRDRLAREFRTISFDIQFKSTQFVNGPNEQVGRLIYNRGFGQSELTALQQTSTWANATPEERAAALKGREGASLLIRRHNQSVARAPLSETQQKQFEVLRSLGTSIDPTKPGGVNQMLAHTTGSDASTKTIRLLASEATERFINLSQPDAAANLAKTLIAEADIRSGNATRDTQFQQLETQRGQTAEGARGPIVDNMGANRAEALVADRNTQILDNAARNPDGLSVNEFNEGLRELLGNPRTRRVLSEVGEQLLEKLGRRAALHAIPTPWTEAAATALDIYDVLDAANTIAYELSPEYRNFVDRLFGWTRARAPDGEEVQVARYRVPTANDVDDEIIVVARRLGGGTFQVTDIIAWPLTKLGEGLRILGSAIGTLFHLNVQEGAPAGTRPAIGVEPVSSGGDFVSVTYKPDGGHSIVSPIKVAATLETGVSVKQRVEISANGEVTEREVSATRGGQSVSAGQIGSIFGSNLARLIQTNDPWGALGVGTVLGTIGLNIGEGIDNAIDENPNTSFADAFENLPLDLLGAGLGAIGSYLFAEFLEDQGLSGAAGEVANSLAGAAIGQIADNIAYNIAHGANPFDNAFSGISDPSIYLNAFGSFLGAKLASEIVQFDTIGGQVGAALGSAVYSLFYAGTFSGAAAAGAAAIASGNAFAVTMFQRFAMQLGSFAGPVGALVGAFIGYIVGGLIGSLFGGTPKAGASLAWNENTQQFAVANVWAKSQGPKDAMRSMASQVGELLNGVIAATGSRVADVGGVQAGAYEIKGKKYWYKPNAAGAVTFTTKDVGQLVNHGAFIALSDLSERLVGGDVYIKRAVAATVAQSGGNRFAAGYAAGEFETNTLFGNISTAQSYGQYLQDAAVINALMAAEPNTPFTAGWTITFARVIELGLDRRWKSDWLGGWAAFLDETADGKIDGGAFAPGNWVANDNEFIVMAAA